MKQVDAHGEKSLHSTVDVNTIHTQLFAAVRATFLTCPTHAAIDIGFDGAQVTDLEPTVIGRNFDNFTRKLMTEHAWVGVNRMAPGEGVEIAAADSHSLH